MKLGHSFRPVEQSLKFLIVWAPSYHNGSERCSFKVPAANLNLITP